MRHLELFSGTHSFGKISHCLGYEITSLDRDIGGECPLGTDYESENHIKEDIMTWDYTVYPPGHFQLITASPVCLWWSGLRRCWIGRVCKSIHPTEKVTDIMLTKDINKYGKPMVDKVREIIGYFHPRYYIIENPQTGRMKDYITDIPFYDVDYCMYTDWGYKKRTRFWTNIEGFIPKICKNNCKNLLIKGKQKVHPNRIGVVYKEVGGKIIAFNSKELRKQYRELKKLNTDVSTIGGSSNRLERYRIPFKLLEELLVLTI